jgi:HlyD family secretion protein
MKKWIIVIVVVLILAGGFYIFGPLRNQRQATASAEFQTVTAERGELTATVGATGVVRANQTAHLSWLTSGTVDDVKVGVGGEVSKDQILATLELTSLPQTIILAQADLVSAQKALDDLLNSELQQAQALQAVEDAERALEDARDPVLVQAQAAEAIANAQKAVEEAERTLRNAQSPANQSFIDEAEAQLVLAKDRLDKAKDKFAPYRDKPEDNLTRASLQSQLSEAQQIYDSAARTLNSLQGTASETDQEIAAANLEKAKAQLAEAQREWERVKDGPSQAKIALLEAQLEDAQREWERLKDGPDPNAIDQSHIAAPFDGVITNVESKRGDQVTNGTLAFRVDDLSHLLVDVLVSEVDINRIKVGQGVNLVFDAILNREYQGTVTEVALVGTDNQGMVDFTVTVELTDTDDAVKPGMTAAVNIIVSKLDDVLLVPNRAVRVLEGQRVVYILKDGNPEPVEIELGASSETTSEVVESEINIGDQIVLNPPTVFSQNGPPPFVQR